MSKFTKTKEWLIEEYVIKNKSRSKIAKECGLTESGLKSLLNKWNIKKEKLNISKETLENLVNQFLSHEEIEKKLKITQTTLYAYLKKYNLKILAKPRINSQYDDTYDSLISQLYCDGFSSTELAKEFGMSHKTILAHLEHYGTKIRTLSESQWNHNQKFFPEELNNYDVIYDLYVTQKISKKDLAIRFNCDPCVIDKVLKNMNISVRNNSESKIGLVIGEQHWNWKGGVTSLAKRLREFFGIHQVLRVLERDHYSCQKCGCKNNLHVHHIKQFSIILKRILEENPNLDPIKNINELYNIAINDSEFCNLDNLITYCKDCHWEVHGYNL